MVPEVRQIEFVQRQVAGQQLGVVATHTVPVDEGTLCGASGACAGAVRVDWP